MVWMRKFTLLLVLNLLNFPNVSHGFTCSSTFSVSNSSRARSLTQIYIHRNSQFPLHVDLIHSALLADILLHKISVESSYNIEHIARALNSMHQKYRIPVRVGDKSESHQPGLRYITIENLTQTVEPMFVSSFSALQNLGQLNKKLNQRQRDFWQAYRDYFDSDPIQKVAIFYKEAIAKPNTDYKTLVQIKIDYHDHVINGLYKYLEKTLSAGLSQEERQLLNKALMHH